MLKFYDVSDGYFSKKGWADDGNGKFAKVYFRINTIGFNSMNGGFENEADRDAFRTENCRQVEHTNQYQYILG